MTPGLKAIRQRAAMTELRGVVVLSVRGPDAIEVVDRLAPRELYLRDGDVLQTLLLDDEGRVVADALLVADEEDFLLLVEGLPASRAHAVVTAQIRAGDMAVVTVEPGVVWSLDGPWSWEVLSGMVGPQVIGLPYLTGVVLDAGTLLLRAGWTGEFGYLLIARPDQREELMSAVRAAGSAVELTEATEDDLRTAAFENFVFRPGVAGLADCTVAELQLQWRVSPEKTGYRGASAVRAAMAHPPARRLGYAWCDEALCGAAAGATVYDGSERVGIVVLARPAPTVGRHAALLMLDLAYAHPGRQLRVGDHTLETVSAPLVDNLSLHVSPQRHRYADRADVLRP